MSEYRGRIPGASSPHFEQQTQGSTGFFSFLNKFTIPTSPTAFIELYGWYLLVAFVLLYFFFGTIKEKILSPFPKSTNDISKMPPKNDLRLHEMRAKQQQRLDKIAQINQEKKQSQPPKLTKQQQQMKNSAAYRYATTGKWGTDDDKGSGGMADAQTLPRYRPSSRHGRRPGGGGG